MGVHPRGRGQRGFGYGVGRFTHHTAVLEKRVRAIA